MTSWLGRLGREPVALATLALLLLYLVVMSGHNYSIDGVVMYRQAVSIVQDHSLRFTVPIYWGDNFGSSKYGIGLSLLYLPGVILFTWLGLAIPVPPPNVYDWGLFYRDPVYALGAAPVQAVLTAATAYLVARLLRELGYGPRAALFGLVAYGIASPAIVYSRGDFAQPLLGLCLIAGLLAAIRYRRTSSRWALVACGASLCYGVLTRPVEGSFLLPAAIVLVAPDLRLAGRRLRRYRALASVVAFYLLGVALTLLVNWGRFGSPLQTGYSIISWSTPVSVGLPGVLVSPARGILWQFPLIALAPLGLLRLWWSDQRRVACVLLGLISLLLINTALWDPWWGAWSWGSRLFVPAFPLVTVIATIGAVSLRPQFRKWLPGLLMLGGFVWAVPGAVTDLLAGYAGVYDGSAQSFTPLGYPPIGAWTFLHHLRASSLADPSGVDWIWFRIAHSTFDLSLVGPIVLLAVAFAVALRVAILERASGIAPVSPSRPTQTATT